MHTSVCEHQTLLDPQESISTHFARDEQSLGVGECWRSILMIFTANISSDFMHLELYYYDFLLILTSSISFDAYLKLGSISANLSRIGANPRPAGLPLPHFAIKLRGEPQEPRVRSYQDGFCKFHKTRPKGLNQVKLSPNLVITRRIRAQFNLRSNMGQVINKSVQHDPEPS